MDLICPVCGKPADPKPSENGGEIFVGEDFPTGVECYEPEIVGFVCVLGHRFYVPKEFID